MARGTRRRSTLATARVTCRVHGQFQRVTVFDRTRTCRVDRNRRVIIIFRRNIANSLTINTAPLERARHRPFSFEGQFIIRPR